MRPIRPARRPLLGVLTALALTAACSAHPAPSTDIVGSWNLVFPESQGPGSIVLEIGTEGDRLVGKALLGGGQEWPLIELAFDGKTFTFRVDNGETILDGTLERKDGTFEGRWSAGTSMGGPLQMKRLG